jgi:hypothetical protein
MIKINVKVKCDKYLMMDGVLHLLAGQVWVDSFILPIYSYYPFYLHADLP